MTLKNPKKFLGQNYLTDKNIAQKIINCLKLQEGDSVLEIGSGYGVLTSLLAEYNINIFAVEIEKEAVNYLQDYFAKLKKENIKIINSDILKIKIDNLIDSKLLSGTRKVKILGNIPYYLTSEILFWLYDQRDYIEFCVLTLQKEVAERLNAKIRTKDYGILTLATELVGVVNILFYISPNCFFPKPKVESAVIKMDFYDKDSLEYIPKEMFYNTMELIRNAFNQRRKKLKNSLKNFIENKTSLTIDKFLLISEYADFFEKRAEELTKDDYLKLYSHLKRFF